MARLLLKTMTWLLAAWMLTGCAFNVGNQELRVRPGTRVPPKSVESGDGDRQYWESWEPDGNPLFLFIRGQF